MTIVAEPNWVMRFHEKLRRAMKDRRISQEEMAGVVDVSQNQVSRWVRGANTPDIYQGMMIARHLGLPLDFLADDRHDDVPAPEFTEDERFVIQVIRDGKLTRDDVIKRLVGPSPPGDRTIPPLQPGSPVPVGSDPPSVPGDKGRRRSG